MSFADSLSQREVEKRKLERAREEKERKIQEKMSWFELHLQFRCTWIAEAGGHSLSGYVAWEDGTPEIKAFPKGAIANQSSSTYMECYEDKELVEGICAGMSTVAKKLGFTRFTIAPQKVKYAIYKSYKPWYSMFSESKIVGYEDKYAIYVEVWWN